MYIQLGHHKAVGSTFLFCFMITVFGSHCLFPVIMFCDQTPVIQTEVVCYSAFDLMFLLPSRI